MFFEIVPVRGETCSRSHAGKLQRDVSLVLIYLRQPSPDTRWKIIYDRLCVVFPFSMVVGKR